MKNNEYQDIMSHLTVTPEMEKRVLDRLYRLSEEDMGEEKPVMMQEREENVPDVDEKGNVVSIEQEREKIVKEEKKKTGRKSGWGKTRRSMAYAAAAIAIFVLGSFVGTSLQSPVNYSSQKAQTEQSVAEIDYDQEPISDDGAATSEETYGAGEEDYDTDQDIVKPTLTSKNLTDQSDKTGKSEETAKDDKLVYTGEIRIETQDYADSVDELKKAIEAAGGYIETETETGNQVVSYRVDSDGETRLMRDELVIRIPASNYEEFMEGLKDIGSILSKSQNVNNVTDAYHDTEVQIKSLKIQEKRLLDMMEEAKTIEDMIRVEDRLTEVQAELESYESSLKSMDDQVEYATVTITLNEVAKHSASPEDGFGKKAISRLTEGFQNFLDMAVSLILAILYLLPLIVVVGLVALIVRAVVKKRARGKQKLSDTEITAEE